MKKWMLLLTVVISLAAGIGWPVLNAGNIIPSLRGNAYSMLSSEQGIFMVLSDRQNNCLALVDGEGRLLNFCRTGRNEAFQYLEADSQKIYAIQNIYRGRTVQQILVTMPLSQISMHPKALCELPVGNGIQWKELYLPPEGENDLLLVGIDSGKQAWLFRYNLQTGHTEQTKILEGAAVYQLKYVAPEYYVFIDEYGRLGQYHDGEWKQDLLKGLAETPMHISTCGIRCFVSDSKTGNIYEIRENGIAAHYRTGSDSLNAAGFTYGDIRLFTTKNRDGVVHVVGLCLNDNGSIVLEEGESPIQKIRINWKTAALLFGRDFLIWTGCTFLLVGTLFLIISQIIASRRVLIRMSLLTVLVTSVLLGGIIIAQRNSYVGMLKSEALEKFKLVGGNLIETITNRQEDAAWPDWEEEYNRNIGLRVREQFEQLHTRLEGSKGAAEKSRENINISILYYVEDTPCLYYDQVIPWGYEIADIKKHEYVMALEEALAAEKPVAVTVQTDIMDELLYAVSFQDPITGFRGCITIEQPLDDVTAAVSEFDKTLLIYVLLGPLLLMALAMIFQRFLHPLKEIKEAMDQFYESGSGNQIFLRDGMAKDEFYDICRTFNKLSMETRVQMNQLNTINGAYARFVPNCMLGMLGRTSVQEVCPGDSVRLDGGILIAAPRGLERNGGEPDCHLSLWTEQVARFEGIITDYDESTGAITAVFPRGASDARSCAQNCRKALQEKMLEGLLIAYGAKLLFGVWGTKEMLLPMAVSDDIRRLVGALPSLLCFECGMIVGGTAVDGLEDLRPLGCLSGQPPIPIWEAFSFEHPGVVLQRRRTLGRFRQAVELFQKRDFYESQALFAQVLREDPQDRAAIWYLFRCEELAHSVPGQQDEVVQGIS